MYGTKSRTLAILIGICLTGQMTRADAQSRAETDISISAGNMALALERLVEQTGIQLLYSVSEVEAFHSTGVTGSKSPRDAVDALLRGTPLKSALDPSGAILISVPRENSPQGSRTDTTDMDKVIVTATRRQTSLAEVPYNLQVITAAKLDSIGAKSATDFLRTIPGMSFIDNGRRGGVSMVLRGLRTTASASTTSIYIDDIEIPSSLDPAILDIDHIEVLRGPQGTLYGSGAIGGTLRYITVAPSLDTVEGRISAEVGRTRHGGALNHSLSAMINTPIATDVSALRVNISRTDNSGYIHNAKLGDDGINWDRNLSSRLALLLKPNDHSSIALTHYLDRSDFGDYSTIAEDIGEYANAYFMPARVSRDTDLTGLVINHQFDGFVATSATTRRFYRSHGVGDGTVSIRDGIFGSFLTAEQLPEMNVYGSDVFRQTDYTQELRLVSDNNDSRFSWVIGAYWTDRSDETRRSELVPVPFPGQAEFESNVIGGLLNDELEYYFQRDTKFRQAAVFGEVGYRITPRWSAFLGGRHFEYKTSSVFYSIDQYFGRDARSPEGYGRTTPYPNEYLYGNAEHSGSIFRFNTSFQLNDHHQLYSTIAEGFRPGGYNNASPNTGIEPQFRTYNPDSILSYEAGGKGTFLNGKIFYSAAAYYVDWQDMQTNGRTDLGFNVVRNAGSASSQGMEMEVSIRDAGVRGLDLGLTYGFTDMTLNEPIANLGRKGDRAPYVPRHSASLSSGYRFDVGSTLKAAINLVVTYTGDSYTTFGDTMPNFNQQLVPNRFYLRLDDYVMAGASVQLSGYNWNLRLGVSNLFDTVADINRNYQRLNSPYRQSFYERSLNRPRTVSLGFAYNF